MLLIQRRYNGNDWEHIATYEDGEFEGDQDFVDGFSWMEGADEEIIMEELDGPDLLAVRPNEDGANT